MFEEMKKDLIDIATKLVEAVDPGAEIELLREGGQWRLNIKTEKDELFKDFKSKTLNSIQHVVRVMVHKKYPEDKTHFLLDVNLSKLNRENSLTDKIPVLAQEEVIKTGRPVAIIGLNGYERKLVHDSLTDIDGLETLSFGEKPNRRLVIRPTGETLSQAGFENARFITIDEIEKGL